MALVLVDVDGTLLEIAHSEPRFIAYLARQGQLGPRQALAFIGFALRWWPRFGRDVFKKDKAYLSGLSADEVAAMAERFVEARLAGLIRPALAQRLRAHAARGDTLALLTGTPVFIARPLAVRLGIEHVIATECATDTRGRYTAAPPPVHPYRHEKLTLAEALCHEHGTRLDQCVAYADSHSDIPLLRAVGTAVAVAPDAGLARAARRAAWEVMEVSGAGR